MITKSLTEEVIKRKNGLRDYMRESTLIELTEFIARVMHDRIVTNEELAQSLGTTVKYVTNIMEGRLSMNVRELSDILYAMGVRLSLRVSTPVEKIDPKLVKMAEKYEKNNKE